MTVLEKIKNYDEESMVLFLFHFSNDVINQFSNFQLPDTDNIREFLNKECPE